MPHGSDAEATDFAAFATAAWPRLVRTARLLTGNHHEAEDLVQTTLAKVYGRWSKVPRDEIDLYVRRALVNNNLSRLRRKRVVHLLTPLLPDTVRHAHAGHADTIDQRTALMAALADLSPRQRAVMVLRYWEDLNEQDIARVLHCSLGTVKTHARRGLEALRTHPALTATPTTTRNPPPNTHPHPDPQPHPQPDPQPHPHPHPHTRPASPLSPAATPGAQR
ncbi:SigE family RNA polymerase sigma factor [Streptomyces fradiae]|uniref:SigE family RNA polymerase sigma factor n=1 Tax=Streptomyces fradiae TaxID=1906 RepID=UPI002941E98A|nr:SigE family RNA polymerase sigma factor [Streptomyces fradiae]WOI63097.1 SigE family RNA polymerase sigma factor [Streptomyces fradiae]